MTVSYLVIEICQITQFIMEQEVIVEVHVSSSNYRQSLLIQVDLETPCNIAVTLPRTVVDQVIRESIENP